jgi:hypothetical protein
MHPSEKGFDRWQQILTADFGRIVTVDEVVFGHPAVYLAFVWRSIRVSVRIISTHGLWPIFALGTWAAWRTRSEPFTISAVVFTVVSAALITLFAFLHYRYAGRFIVLALLLIARALAQSRDRPFPARGVQRPDAHVPMAEPLVAHRILERRVPARLDIRTRFGPTIAPEAAPARPRGVSTTTSAPASLSCSTLYGPVATGHTDSPVRARAVDVERCVANHHHSPAPRSVDR